MRCSRAARSLCRIKEFRSSGRRAGLNWRFRSTRRPTVPRACLWITARIFPGAARAWKNFRSAISTRSREISFQKRFGKAAPCRRHSKTRFKIWRRSTRYSGPAKPAIGKSLRFLSSGGRRRRTGNLLQLREFLLDHIGVGSLRFQAQIIAHVLGRFGIAMPSREDYAEEMFQLREFMFGIGLDSFARALLGDIEPGELIIGDRVHHPDLREIDRIQLQQAIARVGG